MPEGGLADALKPDGKTKSLREAGNEILSLDGQLATGPARGSYGRLPSLGTARGSGGRSYLEEFGDSFLHTVSEQNPDMFGKALETMGILMESDTVFDWGLDLQDFAKRTGAGMPGSVPSWTNVVDAEGVGDFLDRTARYVAAGLGTALGSMTPQLVTGGGGALAGLATAGPPGAVGGAIAGSLMPSVALNMGEAYGTFVEEGVDHYRAAEWAAAITPFTAGLDALGFTKLITKGAGASSSFLRYVGRRIARGYVAEASTEAAQALIKEATAAHLTDNPNVAERASKILDDFLIGGLGGAAISAPAAVIGGRPREAPPPETAPGTAEDAPDPGDLPPEEPIIEPTEDRLQTDYGALEPETTPAAAAPEPEPEPAAAPEPAPAAGEPAPETITVELPDTIIKRNGQPFPSRKAAQSAKRNRNLAEHEVVEVDDGWALQRPGVVVDETPPGDTQPDLSSTEEQQTATAEEVEEAAAETEPEPTEAQKEAGNYRKGTVKVHGLDIAIENAKGSIRRGRGPDGKEWSVEMPAVYGYVKRTEGADGDQVDVYIGPEPEAETAYVVDQVDADSKAFDEHKAMLGYPDEAAALADYDAAFDDGRGPERRGAVTPMPVDEFKAWLKDGDTTKPIGQLEETDVEGAQGAEAPEPEPAGQQADEGAEGRADAAPETPPAAPEPEAERPAVEEAPDAAPSEPAAEPTVQDEPPDGGPVEPEPAGEAVVADVDEQPARIRKRNGDPYPSLKSANAAKRGRGLDEYEPVRVQGGYELVHRDAEPEVEEEVEEELPETPQRQIGANEEGLPLWEDDRGVRSYTRGGIRIAEPVEMIPTRQGYRTGVNPDQRGPEFLTAEELAARAEPEPAAPPSDLQAEIDRINEAAPTEDGGPRISVITIPEPGPEPAAEAEPAPPPRRRRSAKALTLSEDDKAAAKALADMFAEDMGEPEVKLSVRGPGRVRPVSARVQIAAIDFGRRLMANGATGYQEWTDALLDSMDDVQDGLGDRMAPYTRMIYEALRHDPRTISWRT